MHPNRWGDPAAATPLPESARGLIELAFGLDEPPAGRADPVAARIGAVGRGPARRAARASSAPSTSWSTTRPAAGVPAASRRPTCCAPAPATSPTRPTRSSAPDGHDEVVAVLAYAVEHRIAVVPFGGGTCVTGGLAARRDGFAGLVSLDLVRMKRLLAVDEVSMTATLEPGLRGPEAEALLGRARPHARPLPAVVRVRLDRRLRRHPLQRPGQRRLRPVRRHGRRPDRGHARAAS